MSETKEANQEKTKETTQETAQETAPETTPETTPPDLEHPEPTQHSDNEKSKMPERDDAARKQSPADRPGKKPGEGEPSVS